MSNGDNETLAIEIINKKSKNILITTSYRPPNGQIKPFKAHLKQIFEKYSRGNKKMFFLGDYNLNCLDYQNNTKVRNFFDILFSYGMIPIINKPTRVTKTSATAIDNIFINSFFNDSIETGIVKTDISDHFPIFVAIKDFNTSNFPSEIKISKRIITDGAIATFKQELAIKNWHEVKLIACPNVAYNLFMRDFTNIYEKHFPIKEINIKSKNIASPWMTKGLCKSSKRKQKLYNKFLKSRTTTNETNYKNYKNLFEKIKKGSKKQHYSKQLLKHQNNLKKTWSIDLSRNDVIIV